MLINVKETKLGDIDYDNSYELLIDGDMMLYRSAWATEKTSFTQARTSLLYSLYRIFDNLSINKYSMFFTTRTNHREEVWPLYKYNRTDKKKPQHLNKLREFAYEVFDTYEVEEYEADDLIAKYHDKDKTIIVSNDKDFDQLVGFHYPLNKRCGLYWVGDEDAKRFAAFQLLTGDRIDNIPGLSEKAPKRGIGKATANKILDGSNGNYKEVVYECYKNKYGSDAEYMILFNSYLLNLNADPEYLLDWRESMDKLL